MSTEVILEDPPDAGLAWITLLLSSGLLGGLFMWSLQNPALLLSSMVALEQTQESTNVIEFSSSSSIVSEGGISQALPDESSETPFRKLKRQELATLPGLAGRVRYNPQEAVLLETSDKLVNRMFELLFLYVDSEVVVNISSGDFEDDVKNVELSKTRAQNLVAYLVERGLNEKRFEIVPLGREQLPVGGHRVRVYAKDL